MLQKVYVQNHRKKYLLLCFSLLTTLLCAYFFSTLGLHDAGLFQTLYAIINWFNGTLDTSGNAAVNKIILYLRLPRILLALLAGVGLAAAGAVMQSVTRNYLVSPFTLGISSAAAFGASICIVFASGAFFTSDIGIICCAFLASCSCGLVVYGISRHIGVKPTTLVLVGIALNYFFSALTATIEFFAKEHKLEAVVQWTFGSFNRATWESVLITGGITLVCFAGLMLYCLQLDAMSSCDDETVKSLGIDPERLRTSIGLIAVLLTSAIISFTGIIGFVGLIAPHMARFIIGSSHRFYLPCAAILGALLLLASDTVGRLILYPVNIPVGIIISFLGVPLFIHLILSKAPKAG